MGRGDIFPKQNHIILTLSQEAPVLTCLWYKSFENTVVKEEIARKEQFLLFPLFPTLLQNFTLFTLKLELSSANPFSLEEP